MKQNHLRIILLLFLAVNAFVVHAQKVAAGTTTIILFRHAEKDTGDNPPLSNAGKKRAERLPALFPGITPDAFYSTAFIRTQTTVEPWAKKVNRPVFMYDPKKLPDFADTLLSQKGKTIVVVGHSNTIPSLVNLLIGEEKYANLNDSEYSKIFIVTIKKGRAKEKVINY